MLKCAVSAVTLVDTSHTINFQKLLIDIGKMFIGIRLIFLRKHLVDLVALGSEAELFKPQIFEESAHNGHAV